VDDIISSAGLSPFAKVIGPWSATAKGKYFTQAKFANFNLAFEPETLKKYSGYENSGSMCVISKYNKLVRVKNKPSVCSH